MKFSVGLLQSMGARGRKREFWLFLAWTIVFIILSIWMVASAKHKTEDYLITSLGFAICAIHAFLTYHTYQKLTTLSSMNDGEGEKTNGRSDMENN